MRKRSEAGSTPNEEAEVEVVHDDPKKSALVDSSGPLAKALKEAEDVEDPNFVNLPRGRPMAPSFDRVVTKVFVEESDFEPTYDRLMALLTSLEGKPEKAFHKDALTRAPAAHQLASRMVATAKRILQNWEADNKMVTSTMRDRAHRQLQSEKESKSRNKTITDADVDDRTALLYPVEYVQYAKQRGDYTLMVKNLEALVESLVYFNRGLNSLVGSS